ncbi:MAG: hypothetical protein WAP20_08895 [Limnochordia bacterium]
MEERQQALERDVKEIKQQLHETAKKTDVERLEKMLNERDATQTKNMWKLIFILIGVFTLITLAAVGLKESDLPSFFGG